MHHRTVFPQLSPYSANPCSTFPCCVIMYKRKKQSPAYRVPTRRRYIDPSQPTLLGVPCIPGPQRDPFPQLKSRPARNYRRELAAREADELDSDELSPFEEAPSVIYNKLQNARKWYSRDSQKREAEEAWARMLSRTKRTRRVENTDSDGFQTSSCSHISESIFNKSPNTESSGDDSDDSIFIKEKKPKKLIRNKSAQQKRLSISSLNPKVIQSSSIGYSLDIDDLFPNRPKMPTFVPHPAVIQREPSRINPVVSSHSSQVNPTVSPHSKSGESNTSVISNLDSSSTSSIRYSSRSSIDSQFQEQLSTTISPQRESESTCSPSSSSSSEPKSFSIEASIEVNPQGDLNLSEPSSDSESSSESSAV